MRSGSDGILDDSRRCSCLSASKIDVHGLGLITVALASQTVTILRTNVQELYYWYHTLLPTKHFIKQTIPK